MLAFIHNFDKIRFKKKISEEKWIFKPKSDLM